VRLAYAPKPATVGQNDSALVDADGRAFSREVVELARANGSGWHDYRMMNPRSGRIEPKSVYFERVGDVVLGCGIYRREGEEGAGAQRAGARPQRSQYPAQATSASAEANASA
jgi:signal transduction histidine kinase